MRIIPMIQARMGSTRLPGKVLFPLGNEPVLWRVIERVRELQLHTDIEDPVLLTTDRPEDDILEKWALTWGIETLRDGNAPLQLRTWYLRAAKERGMGREDMIVRVCGDSPFIDVGLAIFQVAVAQSEKWDYVGYAMDGGCPAICTHYGLFVEVFRPAAFADRPALLSHYEEHATPQLYLNQDAYKCRMLSVPEKLQALPFSMTIDYKADIERANRVYSSTNGPSWEELQEWAIDNDEVIPEARKSYPWMPAHWIGSPVGWGRSKPLLREGEE